MKRIVNITIGSIIILWTILIYIYAGIFNVGMKTFLAVGLVLLVLGIFEKKYTKLRRWLLHRKVGRITLLVVNIMLLTAFLLVLIESNLMLMATFNKPSSESTLIVLGSQVTKYGPSKMTCLRLDSAYDYLIDHPDSVAVLSGGQGNNEPWSEAKGMADYLMARGVDSNRLYLEDKSTSTIENLRFSMNLIEKKGLNKDVTIVTNAFHVYRAGNIARREGLSFTVLPAKSFYFIFPSYYIRELYAIAGDWILN